MLGGGLGVSRYCNYVIVEIWLLPMEGVRTLVVREMHTGLRIQSLVSRASSILSVM